MQVSLFRQTTCANCDRRVLQERAFVKQVHVGATTIQEHFCGTACHQQWYVNHLRSSGL